ncbi:hypothetical protein [Kutzneria buriramensis]|uniref:hypothetical protein n=1 Tax=Kutzneria buriramensis TaxID=1045776 RepID=UPI0037486668
MRVAAPVITSSLLALLVSAPANASTGGGCGWVEDGATACVSADGPDVVADFYINGAPYGCADLWLTVYDDTQGTSFNKYLHGCSNGHYGWYTKTPNADGLKEFPGINGHRYSSQIALEGFLPPYPTAYSEDLVFSN